MKAISCSRKLGPLFWELRKSRSDKELFPFLVRGDKLWWRVSDRAAVKLNQNYHVIEYKLPSEINK